MDLGKGQGADLRLLRVIGRPLGAFALCALAAHSAALERHTRETPQREHIDPTGSYSFRAPAGWTVSNPRPDLVEAEGDSMVVRFLFRPGDHGFDSLHVTCMQDRLTEAMESDPRVDYEYDFLQAELGDRRVLDSAFRTRYDQPVRGHRDWRQRNLTLVTSGGSLCMIAFCPVRVWKGSDKARALLDGVLMSVSAR
jgi:hypothetical protein